MHAYKVRGQIDETGRLVIHEPIALAPGSVEVIVLQSLDDGNGNGVELSAQSQSSDVESSPDIVIPELSQWFERSPAVPPGYDPEQARLDDLQERYNR
jgi:hypothetical protein